MKITSDQSPLLIVLTGPTASGKTGVSVELAKRLRTEVVSADSRQFFKEMSIGTAKPTEEEMQGVPHHLVGFLSISETYNVGQFEQDALDILAQIFQSYHQAILVGGSGLYIKAVCEGLDPFPRVDPSVRQQLNELYESQGIEALQQQLKEQDPAYYEQVDRNNPHRLIRALEITIGTGQPFSSYRKGHNNERPFSVLKIGLSLSREELYHRINQRVDRMMEQGLLEEVKQLRDFQNYQALQTVGYKELFDYLNGKHDLGTAIEQIKTHTRQYAKRQLTWFRREKDIHWFHPDEMDKMMELIEGSSGQAAG